LLIGLMQNLTAFFPTSYENLFPGTALNTQRNNELIDLDHDVCKILLIYTSTKCILILVDFP